MAQQNFPVPETEWPDQSLPGLARWMLRIATILRGVMQGKLNATGTVTFTVSATSTTVTDARATAFSHISLAPLTANAALAKTGAFIKTRNSGSFVMNHASDTTTDRSFTYLIIG